MNGKTRGDYRVRHGCLPGDDGLTAGVAGQGAGHPEAGQVRGRLHGLAYGGHRLIRAERPGRRPAQPGLKRRHLRAEELAGRRRPHLQRSADQRPGTEPRQQPDHILGPARPPGSLAALHSVSASRAETLCGLGPVVLVQEGGYDLPSPGELVVATLAAVQAGL